MKVFEHYPSPISPVDITNDGGQYVIPLNSSKKVVNNVGCAGEDTYIACHRTVCSQSNVRFTLSTFILHITNNSSTRYR